MIDINYQKVIHQMSSFFSPAIPETATSTSPRPPGPLMKSLSVLALWPTERRLPNLDFPAANGKEMNDY